VGNRSALVAVAGVIVLLVGLPVALLVKTALEIGLPALADGLVSAAPQMVNSAFTGTGATLLAVLLGTVFAVLTERLEFPGRRLLRLAILLGLIVPGYVAGIAWLRAYGPSGLVHRAFGLELPGLQGPLGVVLVLGIEAAPLVYLIVAAALASRAEPDLERAARASGASAWTAFRTVTLPLLWPAIGGAAAISFVLSITAFGAPAVLGIPTGFTTMTTRIYRDFAFSADPTSFGRAVGLAVVLAIAASVAAALAGALLAPPSAQRSGAFGGSAGVDRRRASAGSLVIGGLAWAFVALGVLIPLAALVLTALTRAAGLAPTPDNWTVDNFSAVLDAHTVAALGNSIILSAAAAVGTVALAGIGLIAVSGRTRRSVGALIGITFAIPGSTLAVGVLLAYGPLVRDTLAIILVAYVAKFWVLAYRPLSAALDGLAADMGRAARVSGASAWMQIRTITIPLLRPAIAASAVLVFLFGLHELTMSSLLYGPATATLAVVVLNLQQLGDPNVTAALAVLITLIVGLGSLPLAGRLNAFASARWRG
jgi:iron(III) transport system permease protein